MWHLKGEDVLTRAIGGPDVLHEFSCDHIVGPLPPLAGSESERVSEGKSMFKSQIQKLLESQAKRKNVAPAGKSSRTRYGDSG